jgi:uncharacterized protein (TIGR00369 family)
MTSASNADRFPPLPAERAALWSTFGQWPTVYFPRLVGIELEEVRTDYARMRLPFRPELNQPGGVVHGGAIATLIDTAVVPAISSAYEEPRVLYTIQMQVEYLDPIMEADAIAEAWIEKRGRSTVFCRVEVRTPSSTLAAVGTLIYKIGSPPRPA